DVEGADRSREGAERLDQPVRLRHGRGVGVGALAAAAPQGEDHGDRRRGQRRLVQGRHAGAAPLQVHGGLLLAQPGGQARQGVAPAPGAASLALVRAPTRAAAPAAPLRAAPPFAAVGIASTILFAGYGMRARDVVALLAVSAGARACLWAAWLLVTV